jgi:hypothetical protein
MSETWVAEREKKMAKCVCSVTVYIKSDKSDSGVIWVTKTEQEINLINEIMSRLRPRQGRVKERKRTVKKVQKS